MEAQEEEEHLQFVGKLTGNGEVICCMSPCRLQDYNTVAINKHSATYHHRLFHKPSDYSARDFYEALMRWVEPHLPLPEGVPPSTTPQEPMTAVSVMHGFKCMIHKSPRHANVQCTFVSTTVRGLRHHLTRQHNYPTSSELLCKSVSAQHTRNGAGPRRTLAWVHSYGHIPAALEPEDKPAATSGSTAYSVATRGVVAAAMGQGRPKGKAGTAPSVKRQQTAAASTPSGVELEMEFKGLVAGNGEIVCTTGECTLAHWRVFIDSYDSARTHFNRFHSQDPAQSRAFAVGFLEWVRPRRPLPVGLSKCNWPQPPMKNVPVVEAFRCRVTNMPRFHHVNCNFVSSSVAGLRSHAEKQHSYYHSMTHAYQRVPAQYSRCPSSSTRILVWVEGDLSLLTAPTPESAFQFSADVAGNGMIVCTTFPCTKEKMRIFSDTRAAVKKHYDEFHARTEISSKAFHESFLHWIESKRPLPLGLTPCPLPQPPMKDVPIENGFKCFAGRKVEGKEHSKCVFVSSSIAGLRSHAEKQHHYFGKVEDITEAVLAQRTRNCPGTRQSLVWVAEDAAPLPSPQESDSEPSPAELVDSKRSRSVTAEAVSRFAVLCTTPPCSEEASNIVLDSFPSVLEHHRQQHKDSGRSAMEFYRVYRKVLAPHQRCGSLAPPPWKRSKREVEGVEKGVNGTVQENGSAHECVDACEEGKAAGILEWRYEPEEERKCCRLVKRDTTAAAVDMYIRMAKCTALECPPNIRWSLERIMGTRLLDMETDSEAEASGNEHAVHGVAASGSGQPTAELETLLLQLLEHLLSHQSSLRADLGRHLRLAELYCASEELRLATAVTALHQLMLELMEGSSVNTGDAPMHLHEELRQFIVRSAVASPGKDSPLSSVAVYAEATAQLCTLAISFEATRSPVQVVQVRWQHERLLVDLVTVLEHCRARTLQLRLQT